MNVIEERPLVRRVLERFVIRSQVRWHPPVRETATFQKMRFQFFFCFPHKKE